MVRIQNSVSEAAERISDQLFVVPVLVAPVEVDLGRERREQDVYERSAVSMPAEVSSTRTWVRQNR